MMMENILGCRVQVLSVEYLCVKHPPGNLFIKLHLNMSLLFTSTPVKMQVQELTPLLTG